MEKEIKNFPKIEKRNDLLIHCYEQINDRKSKEYLQELLSKIFVLNPN